MRTDRKIEVSEPVLRQTTLCGHKFACLTSSLSICKVQGHMMKGSLVVDCAAGCLCKYQVSFGTWSICSCPVRREIYDRYAV